MQRQFLTRVNFQQISIFFLFCQSATLKHRSTQLQKVPRVFKASLLNNLVMSFRTRHFLVFLGSVPSFIPRRACLILNTAPPLMSPCGFSWMLWSEGFIPRGAVSLIPLTPPSLRMSSSLAALCSPPRSPLLSVVDWGGDRGETASPPQRRAADCTKGWENLFVSLPFTSISPCFISLLSYQVISLKIVLVFTGIFLFHFFWSKFGKT